MTKQALILKILFLFMAIHLAACGGKGEDESPNVSLMAAPGSVSFEGLPGNPSKTEQLAIQVKGESVAHYRYALVQNSSQCLDVEWSPSRPASELLVDALGADGLKTICIVSVVVQDKDELSIPFSYSWVKDTGAPAIRFNALGATGPNSSQSPDITVSWRVDDELSALESVTASVESSGRCFSSDTLAFDKDCPHSNVIRSGPSGEYSLTLPKAGLVSGQTYTIQAVANDRAGNTSSVESSMSFVWDGQGPTSLPSLNAMATRQTVQLTWPREADAANYLVLRQKNSFSPLSTIPEPPFAVGQTLRAETTIACVTSDTQCTDEALEPYTWFHYQAYAVDAAGNLSAASARALVQTGIEEGFRGLSRIYLASPYRSLVAEWQRYTPAGFSPNQFTYQLFGSSTPGEYDLASPLADSTGESFTVSDSSGADNLYFRAQQRQDNQKLDANREELRLRLGSGIHHKLMASGRFLGQDPLTQVFLGSAWAVAIDPYGNTVFGGTPGRINVLCKENQKAFYCKGRSLDKIYTFAGRDGSDDGSDASLASSTATGDAYSLSFDEAGNLFLADVTNFRIRVVCYDPLAAGVCNGRKLGYVYHVLGTGSSVDGLDDAVAKTTGIGAPFGVAVDKTGNIFVADNTFRKVRVVCFDLTSAPCAGKVVGNAYTVIGTGILGDALDNVAPLAANLGSLGALSVDLRGNIIFSDLTSFRVRAYCRDVSGTAHFCAGKTLGNLQRVSGTGVTGDGLNDIPAATAALGSIHGMSLAPSGNIYLADNSAAGNRLRVICFNPAADEACLDKTSGHSFRLSGTGANTDGANNVLGAAVAIGSPRGLAQDKSGNLVFADPNHRRIRLHCVSSSALCEGKVPDYHYHLAGVGASSLGWNFNAFLTPVGLPQGLAEDARGNLYFADATNFIARVVCYDVSQPGFCYRRIVGHSYIIAGNGVTGNGADNTLAIANSIGVITGVEVDQVGNVLLADSTNRTIRLVCATNTELCTGRSVGSMYRYIGNTTATDTADAAVAASAGMGNPAGVALDGNGNIWIGDAQYFRVRLVCRNTTGACSGRTVGSSYRILGTGVTGNATDGAVAATAPVGALTSLAIDPWGNVILGDATHFFVRVYCQNAAGGYCSGKTSPQGKIFRALGTGVTGDGISDTAATATAISATSSVATDDFGNIFVGESTNRRIRVLCWDATAGHCRGLTSGNSYRIFGSGLAGDASSGVTGASARVDTPSRDGLLFTSNGQHLIYAGGGTPVGLGTVRVFLGSP